MAGAVDTTPTNNIKSQSDANAMKIVSWEEVIPHCDARTFNEKEWRELVWRILTYATSTNTNNNNKEKEKDDLSIRTGEARDLLLRLFCQDESNCTNQDTISNVSTSKSKDYPGWMMVLVDGMWLMGCMYEGGKSSAASSKMESYKALCTLIHGLAYHHHQPSSLNQTLFLERLQLSLEPSTLASAGILSGNNADPMIKRKLKINTDLHYRQTKFNLLQEESQGYAKLLTFLTLLTTAKDEENSSRTSNKIHRYKALMGTFDLDPNRVLDLTLDMMESQILHKLPLEQPNNDNDYLYNIVQDLLLNATIIPNLLHLIQAQYPKHHKKVIPHLLGFKLTSTSKNRDNDSSQDDHQQLSLFVLISILTMHQMCSIQDLLPHLSLEQEPDSPTPLLQQEIHTPYLKKYKQTVQTLKKMGNVSLNSSNAVTNKSATESESTEEQPSSTKQIPPIITLLHVFLQLKCDWNTIIIPLFNHDLSCVQKSAFLYPDTIGNAICHYISSLLLPITSPGQDLLLPNKRYQSHQQNNNSTKTDNTVVSENDLLGPLRAIVSSGSVASHPILYCQLCRYLSPRIDAVMDSNSSNKNISNSLYSLLSEFLVPSLSLFPNNPNISSELWNHVLCKLTYPIRYSLYQVAWKQGGQEKGALRGMKITKALPNIESEIQTGISTRYLLKRMSKDNIRDMGRQISKVSHNNPIIIFSLILNQIESYDNLILLMVETFQFVSVLSLDVMGFSLLFSLSFSNKSKVKEDGVNAAQWISSLETFCGAFYKKFPFVEMRGIICYIMKRLLDGHILELGILRTLLRMAGGYAYADSSSAFLSQVQLDGRCGSKLLKRETSDFGIVEKVNLKSAKQLRKTLQDNSDGVTILILLSQLRNKIIYGEQEQRHIKLIGNLYDCSQRVLDLLVGFLTDSGDHKSKDEKIGVDSSIATYAKSLPPLGELRNDYGLENVMSWMLCRPLIRAAMFSGNVKKETTLPSYLKPFDPTSKEMKETYPLMLPEKAWKFFTTDLFRTFYSLDISDILFPEERYKQEISRLKKEVDRLSELQKGGGGSIATKASLAAAAAAAGGSVRDIRDATVFSKTHEQELDRVKRHAEILLSDMETQKLHVASVKENLLASKDSFWITNDKYHGSHCEDFFTYCVYPRCLVSTEDALFCAHFINLMHDMATPGFYTLDYFNTATDALVGALYCVTEDEARNLGLTVEQMWKILSNWRYDKKTYDISVGEKPGSIYRKEDGSIEDPTSKKSGQKLSYEDFGSVYNRWHDSMGYAFIGCLKSSEYMHTRAALIILTRIVDVYPTRSILGEHLLTALAPLKGDENHMQDIKAMAQAYFSQLTKSRDNGVWQDEDDATAKARIEKEQKLQEVRRKNAEKQHEEMKKDSEKITQQIGGGRTRGRDERNNRIKGNDGNRAPHDQGGKRQLQAGTPAPIAPKFTPANGGPSIHLQRNQNQRAIVPGRGGGGLSDPREYPRGGNEVRRSRGTEPHHSLKDMRGERYPSGEISQQSQQADRRGSDERERDSRGERDLSPTSNEVRARVNQTGSAADRSSNVDSIRRPTSNEIMPYKRGRSPERATHVLNDSVRGVPEDRDAKRQRMQTGHERGNGIPTVPHVVGGGNAAGRSRQVHMQYNSSSQHGDRGNDRNIRRTDRRSKRYGN